MEMLRGVSENIREELGAADNAPLLRAIFEAVESSLVGQKPRCYLCGVKEYCTYPPKTAGSLVAQF
jgi:hypothetical protein